MGDTGDDVVATNRTYPLTIPGRARTGGAPAVTQVTMSGTQPAPHCSVSHPGGTHETEVIRLPPSETWEYGFMYSFEFREAGDTHDAPSGFALVVLDRTGTHPFRDPAGGILAVMNELGAAGWIIGQGQQVSQLPQWLLDAVQEGLVAKSQVYSEFFLRRLSPGIQSNP